jgi:hypothetical protein
MADNIPNLTETDITDLWRFRQEHRDAEFFHNERRTAADQEILRRAVEAKAEILPTAVGDIFIIKPSTYAYDTGAVDRVLFPLIEAAGLSGEWNQYVSHQYKINRPWINRLLKRGEEWRKAIDAVTMASTGQPRVGNGPALADMGDYAPAVQQAQEEMQI